MDSMKDYYQILQIHPDAGQEVMNGAYRSLVKRFHPDQYHTTRKSAMNDKMREINEAYQVLSNPITRADYDRQYERQSVRFAASPKPRTFRQQLRSVLLWSLVSYLVLSLLIRPLLISPWAKILALLVLGYVFIRIYAKQKNK